MVSLALSRTNLIITLTWTSPDIHEGPNITYCVEEVNITSGQELHSECNLTVTEFNFTIPLHSECHATLFTVTPVNVVGSGPGSQMPFFVTDLSM